MVQRGPTPEKKCWSTDEQYLTSGCLRPLYKLKEKALTGIAVNAAKKATTKNRSNFIVLRFIEDS